MFHCYTELYMNYYISNYFYKYLKFQYYNKKKRFILPYYLIFLCFISFDITSTPNKIIRIASFDYPPFIYHENGKNKGVLFDIITEAFRRLDYIAIIDIYPVKRGLEGVKYGHVDAYFSLKKTPERTKYLIFSNTPIIYQKFVIFTLNDSDVYFDGKIETLGQFKIGIQCNTSYGASIDNAINLGILNKIDCGQNSEQNIKKLIAKRVDLVINSRDVGLATLKKIDADNVVRLIMPEIDTIGSYIAFTKVRDYTDLSDKFDYVFNGMIIDGTIERIKEKYGSNIELGY